MHLSEKFANNNLLKIWEPAFFNTFSGTIYLYVVPSFGFCVLMRYLIRQQGITTCLVDVASHLVKTFIHQVKPFKKLF
jgi:hypothetical protein